MRRLSSSVRPFRRAVEAEKLVRSPSGIPTRTTRPPGRTSASVESSASSLPDTSNPTSTSNGAPAAPSASAAARRCGIGSAANTSTPSRTSSCTISNPSGPQPKTAARSPGATAPRSSACNATPSGSSSVAASSPSAIRHRLEQPLGPGELACAGRRRCLRGRRSAPWGRDCRARAGSSAQRPHGSAGSTATRSPARGPAAIVPAISWPRTSGRATVGVADSTFDEPVPVGAAEADGVDAHDDLAGLRHGLSLVDDAQLACSVEPERLHGCP